MKPPSVKQQRAIIAEDFIQKLTDHSKGGVPGDDIVVPGVPCESDSPDNKNFVQEVIESSLVHTHIFMMKNTQTPGTYRALAGLLIVAGTGAMALFSVYWFNWPRWGFINSWPGLIVVMLGGPILNGGTLITLLFLRFRGSYEGKLEIAAHSAVILGVAAVLFLSFYGNESQFLTILPIVGAGLIVYRCWSLKRKGELDSFKAMSLAFSLFVALWVAEVIWISTDNCAFGSCA